MGTNAYTIIPFRTIGQSLELYKNLHAPSPSFGMDLYRKDFVPGEIVLLSNNGDGNKGIPIRCDHYILVLCIKGEGFRRINHHRFQIVPHSAHMILPGQIHSFNNTTNDFEIFILLFEPAFLAQLKLAMPVLDYLLDFDPDCSPNMKLEEEEFNVWLSAYKQINEELLTGEKHYSEIVATLILNLLFRIKRKVFRTGSLPEKRSRQWEILTSFRKLIEKHFLEMKTVREYADLLNLTPKHLSESVKSQTNHTALHFLHERIIHEAEYLLVYSHLSIKEISNALSFDNPSHFGRFFKRHKGITPLFFRSQNQ